LNVVVEIDEVCYRCLGLARAMSSVTHLDSDGFKIYVWEG
jgi:hypothetical protein